MEDKNELSDIVLEKDDGTKSMKLKRILVIAAVLVLLFLAILIVMRALNKPEQSDQARLVLPPEPQSAPLSNEEQLFQQVPIIEEDEKESFEDMVKKLKEKEIERTSEPKQELASQEKPAPVKSEIEKVDSVEPKATPKPKTKETQKSAPKKTASKPVTNKIKDSKIASSGTYIQVASIFKNNPDPSYLKSLEKKGYDYRLYKTTSKDQTLTKVLIGPFGSSNDAREALANIRKDLVEGAFIFRVP